MTGIRTIWQVPDLGFDVVDFHTEGPDFVVVWSYGDPDWEGSQRVIFRRAQAFEFRALPFADPPEREPGRMGMLLELDDSAYERRIVEGRTQPSSAQSLRAFQLQLPDAGLIQVIATSVDVPSASRVGS